MLGRYLDVLYRRNPPLLNATIGAAVMICSEFIPGDYTGGELIRSGFFVSGALLTLSGSAKIVKSRLVEYRAGRTLRTESQEPATKKQ